MIRRTVALLAALGLWAAPAAATTVTFEDLGFVGALPYESGEHLPQDKFTSAGVDFNNDYSETFASWRGFAYAKDTNLVDPSYLNQYSAYHLPGGGGAGGSTNFAVGFFYDDNFARITLPPGATPVSAALTNITYGALAMRDGNAFSRQFGAPPPGEEQVPAGEWPDWFKLTITGLDSAEQEIGSVDFYLADYRGDSASDYIIDQWTTVDLSSLSGARYLTLKGASSDVGEWGSNTPMYMALDNLEFNPAVPGDANGDTLVDGADYTIWADHFQQSGGYAQGDFNGDGVVDGADYTIWADHFAPASAALPVPEPATGLLFALGTASMALGMRRGQSARVRRRAINC
ncbi:MAG: DUF4465 domain-containing protein [Pirellulales bacterium]|nr:DUF4465 domain-containing protein [Pirellulales bacterium]